MQQVTYKQSFKSQFDQFISSKLFNKLVSILSLAKFTFEVLEPYHRNDLIDFLSYVWSYKNVGKSVYKVFELEEKEQHIWLDNDVDKIIKVGGGIVIRNELGKIVGFVALTDCFDGFFDDIPDTDATLTSWRKEIIHAGELYLSVLRDFVSTLKANKYEHKYGRYAHPGYITVDPKYRKQGLFVILSDFVEYFCVTLGYKYMVLISTSLLTATPQSHFAVCDNFQTKKYDFSVYIFEDGTSMKYYCDRFQSKYSLNDEQMIEIKKGCQMTSICGIYSGVSKNMMESKMLLQAKEYAKYIKQKSKL